MDDGITQTEVEIENLQEKYMTGQVLGFRVKSLCHEVHDRLGRLLLALAEGDLAGHGLLFPLPVGSPFRHGEPDLHATL